MVFLQIFKTNLGFFLEKLCTLCEDLLYGLQLKSSARLVAITITMSKKTQKKIPISNVRLGGLVSRYYSHDPNSSGDKFIFFGEKMGNTT